MEDNNPYKTPDSELTQNQGKYDSEQEMQLAGRGQRLAAALIDMVISILIALAIMIPFGMLDKILSEVEPSLAEYIMLAVLSFIGYILVNGYFLHLNGQTVGKKLLSIRISNLQGQNPGLGKIVFVRYLPIQIIAQIPLVGGIVALVDVLMIFGSERRCLHDHIAGTIVVHAD